MLTTRAADGSEVRAYEEGSGPTILILHGGIDDGSRWQRVADQLTPRFRVVRMIRRQYRLDLPAPVTIAQEVLHVQAVAELLDGPVLLFGHSSGGVVALETLLETPFAGAMLYEPPITIPQYPWDVPVEQAMDAVDHGKVRRALAIFLRDIIRLPGWAAQLSAVYVAASPSYAKLAPRQIFDAKAIHEVGNRLEAYARITVPTTFLSGERSPAHLGERIDELVRVMPHAEKVMLPKQGHGANVTAPKVLAEAIATEADQMLHR